MQNRIRKKENIMTIQAKALEAATKWYLNHWDPKAVEALTAAIHQTCPSIYERIAGYERPKPYYMIELADGRGFSYSFTKAPRKGDWKKHTRSQWNQVGNDIKRIAKRVDKKEGGGGVVKIWVQWFDAAA